MNRIIKLFLSALILLISTNSTADILLNDAQGHNIPFSSLKGKWVLINYWASWCKVCIDEIPQLNRFYQTHEKEVALFAVNYDALPLHKHQKLIKDLHILYPSLIKDPAFALGLGDIIGVPVTFLINPEGKLVDTLYGGQSTKSLEQSIREHS
jgi:thiol-disulfide isomerase/thioredoxin